MHKLGYFINKFSRDDERIIRYVIKSAMEIYGINENHIVRANYKFRPVRMSIVSIIYQNTDLTQREIAMIFNKSIESINKYIIDFRSFLRDEKDSVFVRRHSRLKNAVSQFIKTMEEEENSIR